MKIKNGIISKESRGKKKAHLFTCFDVGKVLVDANVSAETLPVFERVLAEVARKVTDNSGRTTTVLVLLGHGSSFFVLVDLD